jgi:hypothetical protein
MRARIFAVGLSVVFVLVFASSALAGGSASANSVYPSSAAHVQASIVHKQHTTAPTPSAVKSSGTLPFTGVDLGVVGGAAALLVALGFGVRLVARDRA